MRECTHFDIEELVSEAVFRKYGIRAWAFFDPRLLVTIDWLRENIGKPIIINNWVWSGDLSQRGLRENTCAIVVEKTEGDIIYLSGHVLGMAVDFDVEGMTSEEVRKWIIEHQDELPFPVRLEKGVSWCHLGVDVIGNNKVELFKP